MHNEKKNEKIENLSIPFTIANIQWWINHKNIAKDWNFTWWVFEETKVRKTKKKKKKTETLILVASAAKLVAADKSPKKPTTQHTIITFLSIFYVILCVLSVFFSECVLFCEE